MDGNTEMESTLEVLEEMDELISSLENDNVDLDLEKGESEDD